jgi:hypothetical protein
LVKEPTPEKSSINGTMATDSIGILRRSANHREGIDCEDIGFLGQSANHRKSIDSEDIHILGRSANHCEGIDGEEDAAAGVIGGWLEQLQLDEMVV